ncbi:Outer membrane protein (porin) [Rhodoferax sp. OV413]|uniref:porin n=1 Tax=Rhodoferax sp. OV413 TaxID=1855285 RepID=UPI000882067C|nr:porin [Rhodoferax sp. OV413]SDP45749.1 Outer membrane protein (porin) [Rhodoferax sp. OV413]
MKKKLATALTLVAAGAAHAQTSLTVFGILDVTLQRAQQGGASMHRLNGVGGHQFSRIGFRGTEDLGDGLSAGFVLDAGLNMDTGAGALTSTDNLTTTGGGGLTFNRRATVSLLSKTWGELRLGRDFVPTYWNHSAFDPFGSAGAGSVNNVAQGALTRVSTVQTAVRASNSLGYVLPGLNGFYGQAMYAFAENTAATPATRKDGKYAGIRLGYAQDSVSFAVSHGVTNLNSGDVTTSSAGASYQFGAVKAMALVFRDDKEVVAAPNRSHGWMLGTQINLGLGYIPISYSRVKDNSASGRSANQMAAGYVYNLSKRTAVYSTYSRLQNRNGAALTGGGVTGVANATWTGLDLGIRHSF